MRRLFLKTCWNCLAVTSLEDLGKDAPAIDCIYRDLRRQPGATFGSSGLDNQTPTSRLHTSTKTVGSRTFDITGLECTFHDFASSLISPLQTGRASPSSGRRDNVLI